MTDEKQNIDCLLDEIQSFRNSKELSKLFLFIAQAVNLGAYNSMLVYNQNPNSTIVMEQSKWEKRFNKGIKPNAHKMVILFPFGPIHWVYDYEDTYDLGLPLFPKEEELVEIYKNFFKPNSDILPEYMENTIKVLPWFGVYLDTDFVADFTEGGYIKPNHEHDIKFEIKKRLITRKSSYVIAINKRLDDSAKLMTIIHELAHLFLEHVSPAPDFEKPWQQRLETGALFPFLPLPNDAEKISTKEMEAEITKELVCNRLKIDDRQNAIRYLSSYEQNFNRDEFSSDRIIAAVEKIEKILKGGINFKNSLLYEQISRYRY